MQPMLPFRLFSSQPMTMETREPGGCGQVLLTSCRSHSVKILCWEPSAPLSIRVKTKRGCAMLQTATAVNYQALAAQCVKPPANRAVRSHQTEVAKRSTSDLSALYPQAVLRSSDASGWQNVRAIQFRPDLREVIIPASDDHCMVLNLGASFFTNVFPGKRRFDGEILP